MGEEFKGEEGREAGKVGGGWEGGKKLTYIKGSSVASTVLYLHCS